MPCGPSSTTIDRLRGNTLVEMLVASAIFFMMTAILLTLLVQNQKAATKISNHNDATAEVLIVYEKVRLEIRRARVIGNEPPLPASGPVPARAGAVKYWVSRMVNEIPQLTASGMPDWMPGAPSPPQVAYMYSLNGALLREFPAGVTESLTRMGKDGHIQFSWDPGSHNLTLQGAVGEKNAYDVTRHNYQPFMYLMYANNND